MVRTSSPRAQNPAPHHRIENDHRTSSLTQRSNAPEQILLIGDSLIRSVNPKGLNSNVFKNGISGATIGNVLNQIKLVDLKEFSHVVIYVVDASNGVDIEYFEELYDQVRQYIKDHSHCKIIL